jgi:hypothetical protein
MKLNDRTRRGLCFGLMLVLSTLVGCRSNRPAATVELRAVDESRVMEQRFQKAFFTRDAGGDYDIVLLDQNGGLKQTDAALTHVLHIRVLWRSKSMMRGDSPTATNCSLRYAVLNGEVGAVTYDGVGFASVYGGDDQVRVMLSNATLTPAATRGDLNDPLGKSTITADFKARRNSTTVKDLIAMTRDAAADRTNPPPRPPGP